MLTLYKNIKKLREELGMSQDELAEKTGYTSRSSIAKIEKGLVDLQQSKIINFANALGVTPSQLMGWDDQPATIAAHKDGDNFTPDELAKIEEYKKLLLAARPKEFLNAAHSNGATPDQAAAADSIMKDDDEWK